MERWAGKIFVVTGASDGIGETISRTLAKKGTIVVGLARSEDKLQAISMATKGKFHGIKCDLKNEKQIISAFRKIEEQFGGVDVLVNNAGTFNLDKISEGQTSAWKDILDLNILGVSICCREALKSMKTRGDDCHIINVNSTLGHDILPSMSGLYPASKIALRALTETLRNELRNSGSQIKLTNLSPGLVHTKLGNRGANQLFGATLKEDLQIDESPPQGFMASQDVADAVISILSMRPTVEIQEFKFQSSQSPAAH